MSDHASMPARLICVAGLRGIPGIMGGVESHCEQLLPRVVKLARNLKFVVIGRTRHIGAVRREWAGLEIVPLPAPRRQGFETLGSTFLAILYARRRRAWAVHLHALASGNLAPLAKALGMRVVMTVHGADHLRPKWGRKERAVLRMGERLGVTRADAVICVAPSLAEAMRRSYPGHAQKIVYIPNGIPAFGDDGAAETVLGQFGLSRGDFVLAVGRIEPGKGFDLLIDAFAASGSTRKLVIVGGAHHEDRYFSDLKARAGANVLFTGVQPHDVLGHLYRAAALFVLPSLHEGLPISALEAGSVDCPLLLSDIPPNRDLGLSDAHYFRSGDVGSLAAALRRPVGQFAVSASQFRQFDWDSIAAQTLAIYEKIAAKP